MPYTSHIKTIAASLPAVVATPLRLGAERVEAAAKGRVPVASGDLRNAIHVEEVEDGYAVAAGDDRVFYGHLVEHGGAHTPARPFLVPALEECREEIVEAVAVALRGL